MELPELFSQMPFNRYLGIELLEAADGRAVGRLELAEEHASNPQRFVAHGGVTYALADTIAGAAVLSANRTVTPTIDMRIDYLAPATGGELRAEATVLRNGDSVATVEVDVTDDEGRAIATARGTYKTGGGDESSAWREGDGSPLGDDADGAGGDEDATGATNPGSSPVGPVSWAIRRCGRGPGRRCTALPRGADRRVTRARGGLVPASYVNLDTGALAGRG